MQGHINLIAMRALCSAPTAQHLLSPAFQPALWGNHRRCNTNSLPATSCKPRRVWQSAICQHTRRTTGLCCVSLLWSVLCGRQDELVLQSRRHSFR